ncbi:hypothetical protein MRX96_033593 [Rhipicephalus microplus]
MLKARKLSRVGREKAGILGADALLDPFSNDRFISPTLFHFGALVSRCGRGGCATGNPTRSAAENSSADSVAGRGSSFPELSADDIRASFTQPGRQRPGVAAPPLNRQCTTRTVRCLNEKSVDETEHKQKNLGWLDFGNASRTDFRQLERHCLVDRRLPGARSGRPSRTPQLVTQEGRRAYLGYGAETSRPGIDTDRPGTRTPFQAAWQLGRRCIDHRAVWHSGCMNGTFISSV